MIKIVILAMCVFAISAAVVPKSHGIELSVAQQKDMIDDILSWLAAFGLANAGQIAVAIVDALVTGSWDNVIALGGSFLGPIIAGLAAILFGGRLSWDQVVDALIAAGLGVLTDLPGLIPALIALDWATVWDIVFKHLGTAVFSLLPELMAIVLGLVGKRQIPGGLTDLLISLIPGGMATIIAIHQWATDNHESVTQAIADMGINIPAFLIPTLLSIIAQLFPDGVKRQIGGIISQILDFLQGGGAGILTTIENLMTEHHETVQEAIAEMVAAGQLSASLGEWILKNWATLHAFVGY